MASGHKLPPFFVLPFAAPAPLWTDLSLEDRTPWYGWANATPVGWLDFKTILRPPEDAYTFARTAEALPSGGVSSLTSPPPPPATLPPPLSVGLMSATELDSVAFRSAITPLPGIILLVWATASAVAPTGLRVQQNKFVGSFPIAAGQPLGQALNDIGSSYVAAFGSLAGKRGEYIQFWWWASQSGNLAYGGQWRVQVSTVSISDCQFFWPLNEPIGLRQSLAEPLTLTPVGGVSSGPGPIDTATQFDISTASMLATPTGGPFALQGGSVTLVFKVRDLGATATVSLVSQALDDTLTSDTLLVNYDPIAQQLDVEMGGTGGSSGVLMNLATPWNDGAWHSFALQFDMPTLTMRVSADTQDQTAGPLGVLLSEATGPASVGSKGGLVAPPNVAMAELGWWRRRLDDAEITMLATGQPAESRYPFTYTP